MIDEVIDNIGIQIYQYLHPKDLFFLSICNHKLYNDIVHQKLAEICISHLPLHLGAGTNYLGTFREGSSFGSKAELVELILDKADVADLLLESTATVEQSRRRAREMILDVGLTYCCFYPRGSSSSSTSIDCHYHWEVGNVVASNWVDQIMDRSTFRKDREAHALVKSWSDFLFALQNTNRGRIKFGLWRWTFKNPKLNGQGIAGSGVMINIQQQNEEEGNNSKIVEISFTRIY